MPLLEIMLRLTQPYRALRAPVLRFAPPAYYFRGLSTPADLPIPNKSKVWDSADEAVKDIKSGSVLLCGGESCNIGSTIEFD